MKRLAILIASCLAACGDDVKPIDPVDMTFVADVTELENTCDDRPLDTDRAYIGAWLHADGTVELLDGSVLIPGPGSFPNVRPHGGRVDYDANRYSTYPDKTYPYRIEGTLTMSDLDLTMTEHWYRNPGFADCIRKVRVVGVPRGFLDPASLDGTYEIHTSYYGEICGGLPPAGPPLGEQVYVLDAHPETAGVVIGLADAIFLQPPMPASDGAIDWDGTVYLAAPDGIEELDGGLHGVFTPSRMQAELTFRTPDQPLDCRHTYLLDGAKRAADASEVGNDYRAVYRLRDECEGTVSSYEGGLRLTRQSATEIEVYDDWGDWFIEADGATLYETDGSEAEGQVATFAGTAAPPYVSYTLEFRFFNGDGTSCVYAWDVDAVARYHPEFAWDPAFLPDPPDPNDKTGILARSVTRARSAGPFLRTAPLLGPLDLP